MRDSRVFISYSHDSPEHCERVLELSDQLRGDGIDCTIDQYETSPPEGWPKWMDGQIEDSDFILVVCTEIYHGRVIGKEKRGKGLGVKWESTLAYQDIYDEDAENTRFIPVLLEPDDAEYIPKPLKGATYYCVKTEEGCENLYRHLTNQPRVEKPELGEIRKLPAVAPREPKQDYLKAKIPGPEKVSIGRLPQTDPDLFGREKELKMLDEAWEDPETNVISLVAWGGVGKTSLVNKWLVQMGGDRYRGAEMVYGWSFYSQGTSEDRQVSADMFIATALGWFGDPNPDAGSPWDKVDRLTQRIRERRTLLILDGLEPLQYLPTEMEGRLKDRAFEGLLRELALYNPGLCVITTRWEVGGLTAQQPELEHLTPEAGAQLLSRFGVRGPQEELEEASEGFGGHALALTLLGSLLRDQYGGDVRCWREIDPLEEAIQKGGHARRVMESYERWLGEGPELSILRLLGLFDRPAEAGALAVLREAPVLPGLTDALFRGKVRHRPLSDRNWDRAVTNLRYARLLLERDSRHPETLDAHPLIREHFGEKLRESNPAAWKKAHNRLYEYYKSQAEEYPSNIKEMAPLYAAVAHGCQADRHQEALDEVYKQRIQRGDEFFNARKLGALGAELAALSGFFDPPWDQPVAGLTEADKSFVLNEAGFDLRALGRLAETGQPMQAALEAEVAREDWKNAAIVASNLGELHLTIGDMSRALDYARQSVQLAGRSGDVGTRVINRATLANALHRSGQLQESEASFRAAEEMQKADQPEYPLLYSLRGFLYCNLLLDQGKYQEVQNRAGQTLEWAKQGGLQLLTFALEHLSLGRAHLLQAQAEGTKDFTRASDELDQAVDGLRQSGHQDYLPLGLLARTELNRVCGDYDTAQRELDEAMTIATRGGMRLHEADCHLGYARLYLAMGSKEKARESLDVAKGMVENMGYGRRRKDIEELEGLF
ncbi:TIR domain-containing protein [Candidatus Poribacteria bacterium]